MKISSRWYPAAWMASIMGILSLSFLLGPNCLRDFSEEFLAAAFERLGSAFGFLKAAVGR